MNTVRRLVGLRMYHDCSESRHWGTIMRDSDSYVWIKWDGNDGPLRRWRKECGFFKHCCHVEPNNSTGGK